MMKIDKILENYPELDNSRKAELKKELLGLFSVSGINLPPQKCIVNNNDDIECHPNGCRSCDYYR